jgi:hypothetical protein
MWLHSILHRSVTECFSRFVFSFLTRGGRNPKCIGDWWPGGPVGGVTHACADNKRFLNSPHRYFSHACDGREI